ncbi:MAG: hypothetical protein ACJ76B_12035 [Solirubrobacterales bacterium]
MSEQVREAMRWLLLPIPVEGEEEAVAGAESQLELIGVRPEDARAWVDLELEAWRESGGPSKDLKAVVSAYLRAGDPDLGGKLSSAYFPLHASLAAQPAMGHDTASAVLSHARLMALLAREENLTAAQIAKLVSARDRRTPLAWRQVKPVLAKLKVAPSLDLAEVEALYEADERQEVDAFADADEMACNETLAAVAKRLGYPGDLAEPLRALLPADATPFGPYLQILHFQCVIAEHYDHSLSNLYEFNPRGKTPKWLFERYPSSLEVRGNPFLNNAKSVDELNEDWARSKKPERRRQAYALVAVIEGLDSLGYSARRELAAWLRRLLVRRIRIAKGHQVKLPKALTAANATAVLKAIAAGETSTWGILEQRVVDAVASLRHPSPEWLGRGLLDSVNATNVSRRKCGDCDFQNATEAKVIAYEAHAGKLTDPYVQGHLRTLEAVLALRAVEWEENVGPGLKWEVTVTFVAHEVEVSALPTVQIGDATVRIEAIDYSAFLKGLTGGSAGVKGAVNRYVREPLAAPRTPDSVRAKLLAILP